MLFVQSAALVFTVWKFQKFSVTQILHEINFGELEPFGLTFDNLNIYEF